VIGKNRATALSDLRHLSTGCLDPSPTRRAGLRLEIDGRAMGDHIAAAQRYRARAAKCELFAKNTSSMGFGECYRLLAQQYLVLANLEDDCARRPSPFARQEHQKEQPKPADQPPARPVCARMSAERQLQMTAPSTETVSMPPM